MYAMLYVTENVLTFQPSVLKLNRRNLLTPNVYEPEKWSSHLWVYFFHSRFHSWDVIF